MAVERTPMMITVRNKTKNVRSSHKKIPNSQNPNLSILTNVPAFTKWGKEELRAVMKDHKIPCIFVVALLFFLWTEYTLNMISPSSPPFDVGFVVTAHLHRILAADLNLNNLLAGLNTVYVGMQASYIIGTWVLEDRPRCLIAALFMFTCRGILGYSTQLPLPQEYLWSGVDFPVGNLSFFLFFSGHVAASIVASIDMRRFQRNKMAYIFDVLNVLQIVRLLASRGHYTIDLAAGIGAGILFDSLAGTYLNRKQALNTTSRKLVNEIQD